MAALRDIGLWVGVAGNQTSRAGEIPTFSHHLRILRILREAGLVTKRIQGARGYAQLRKQDVDHRFPGLLDSIINADAAAQV